jgi:hypothetical protein
MTKVCIICPTHGEFWQTALHYTNKTGCPHCNTPSKGEMAIDRWLKNRGIEFIHHYFFSDLKGDSSRKPLSFDFFIKYVKILIEFDGQHHFHPVRFNGISEDRAIKIHEKAKYYDSLKDDYCRKNNLKLIRISYKNFKNINEILCAELLGVGLNPLLSSCNADPIKRYINDSTLGIQASNIKSVVLSEALS